MEKPDEDAFDDFGADHLDAIEVPQKGHTGMLGTYGQRRGPEAPTTPALAAAKGSGPPESQIADALSMLDADEELIDAAKAADPDADEEGGNGEGAGDYEEDATLEMLTGEGAESAERPSSDDGVEIEVPPQPMPSSPVTSAKAPLAMSKNTIVDKPVEGQGA